ncbi:MAG: DNA gyrase subunit A [Armatimonadota bacterium]
MTDAIKAIQSPIEDEMKDSYLDYAMSVIVSRALPDARDGLKPVHRRILFSMYKQNLMSDRPFKKSATIVGDVIGKYHPHGDMAVYDALVRMAQDFNLRYMLVNGHGNFGSIDGDPPAAYRYTEARMQKMAEELLEDIQKETVNFRPNFDESLEEPEVLPSQIPNLLINGATGIAVGMATNIPPHNLSEVIDGTIELIDNPDVEIKDLMKHIKAPDFPTGASIMGLEGAKSAYHTGRGSVTMRAKTEIEERKGNRQAIIISEIPYQVNKARLIEKIAEGVNNKKITGVTDIRDESDRRGMRVVIELQHHANPQLTMNQLIKHSDMQCNFGIILLALVDGAPKVINLKEALSIFVKHRKEVVVRRSQYDLKKARERAHILEGLRIALDKIDLIIKTIRASKTAEEAKASLIKKFSLSEIQAQAILDMRLQRLTGLEREKIEEEYKEILKKIDYLETLLKSEKKIYGVIKDELLEIKKKYGDERRTKIKPAEDTEFEVIDLIPQEDVVITVTSSGYIKRQMLSAYRSQKRGGRGVVGMTVREEDHLEHMFITTTHHDLAFFTNTGKIYRLKVYEVPEAGRQAKGTNIINLLHLSHNEKISDIFPVKEFDTENFLLMATKKGVINKTPLRNFLNIRKTGIFAIKLDEDDELVDVRLTEGKKDIILITKNGLSIRFNERAVRPTGRMTRGVKGITLKKNDEVVAMIQLDSEKYVFVATDRGYGKRTDISQYRPQGRGGKGIKTLTVAKKNGHIVSALGVVDDDELMLISRQGTIIRIKVNEISKLGRATQGVILMRLDQADELTSVGLIRKEDEKDDEETPLIEETKAEKEVKEIKKEKSAKEKTEKKDKKETKKKKK